MKRILPNNKIVNREVKQADINKNNDVDIEYNIKRIKKERRYTLILVICFLILFLTIFYYIFSKVQNKIENYKVTSGNLTIQYDYDINGIKDTINMRSMNDNETYKIKITNNSDKTNNYIVYLSDDEELISLEGCSNNIVDYSKLKVKVNDNKYIDLLSTKKKNKYIIYKDSLKKDETVSIKISTMYDKSITKDYHYHGRIIVKEKSS